jgi:hypothetical protein
MDPINYIIVTENASFINQSNIVMALWRSG